MKFQGYLTCFEWAMLFKFCPWKTEAKMSTGLCQCLFHIRSYLLSKVISSELSLHYQADPRLNPMPALLLFKTPLRDIHPSNYIVVGTPQWSLRITTASGKVPLSHSISAQNYIQLWPHAPPKYLNTDSPTDQKFHLSPMIIIEQPHSTAFDYHGES